MVHRAQVLSVRLFLRAGKSHGKNRCSQPPLPFAGGAAVLPVVERFDAFSDAEVLNLAGGPSAWAAPFSPPPPSCARFSSGLDMVEDKMRDQHVSQARRPRLKIRAPGRHDVTELIAGGVARCRITGPRQSETQCPFVTKSE